MAIRVVIDWDRCESNGQCMKAAPEVFRLHEDDRLEVLSERPGVELLDKVKDAIRRCPRAAISLIDEK